MASQASGWHIGIDRGGTFTDVVAQGPSGQRLVRKVLSKQPGVGGDPAVRAIAELLELPEGQPWPQGLIAELRLGTTVATNALLEQRGARVLLLINRGFGDLLTIGDLHRPELFARQVRRSTPLDVRVIEVAGRLAADGRELEPLQLDGVLRQQVGDAMADGYRSCAVALLHSYRNPSHETQLGAWLQTLDPESLCLSHRLSRLPRLVPRGQTALVEAAVAPVLRRYLDQLEGALGAAVPLRVMRSSGALAPRPWLLAKDTILSGPAGGMVGALAVASEALAQAGLPMQPVIGFDMGGTSTDVFYCPLREGELQWQRSPETAIAGLQLQAPMLPIHTVAAGGGSIVATDGDRLQVGPQSAGADPGPAAYRRGGPLTVTDANVLLGRLPPTALPPVFGPSGDQCPDLAAVQQGFAALAAQLAPRRPGLSAEQLADGALQIAIETMAAAIRRISLERGEDPRAALLVSYGGAAAQHACRLAEALGIRRVLVHPLAGVLSAYGIGRAPQSLLLERTLRQPLQAALLPLLRQQIAQLLREGTDQLAQVVALDGAVPQIRVQLELRHPGQEQGFVLPWDAWQAPPGGIPEQDLAEQALAQQALAEEDLAEQALAKKDLVEEDIAATLAALQNGFAQCHQQRYGYPSSGEPLVVERLLLELQAEASLPPWVTVPASAPPLAAGDKTTPLWLAGCGWCEVPLHQRAQLPVGQELVGPAVVVDATTTCVLERHWRLQHLAGGSLLLEAPERWPQQADQAPAGVPVVAPGWDPVLLELYQHRFAAIAVSMGVQLQQSARSLNIRERLDFSCALFDAQGALVANAPHIPVHLGSMGESVASLRTAIARGERQPLSPGDVVLSNNPYNGGTHLPDITAITPVFAPGAAAGAEPLLYVASRGHHSDVGGITPGSMPATSTSIEDEGLLIDNLPLLQHGNLDEPLWRQRFAAMRHPVRNPDMLLADLQAQVAANRCGTEALMALIARHGLAEVQTYMGHVQANAAAAVRRLIGRLQDGNASVELDHGGRICVAVQVDQQRGLLQLDFGGTSAQHPGNLNAPLAVTRAVVLYVVRLLLGEPIPLNAGCFAPITLIVPPGTLLNPLPPAAVVAGNVEISQATANVLLAALGAQAASQGTMNNLSFGNSRCQYYETIGGGCGAGPGYGGGSAFQSHMTNSRLTDPEVLEDRLPLRVECMAIRHGSGGRGTWAGGDGVVRQLRFLEPMQVSLISGSRLVPPAGLAGGEPGACGRNLLGGPMATAKPCPARSNGSCRPVRPCASKPLVGAATALLKRFSPD